MTRKGPRMLKATTSTARPRWLNAVAALALSLAISVPAAAQKPAATPKGAGTTTAAAAPAATGTAGAATGTTAPPAPAPAAGAPTPAAASGGAPGAAAASAGAGTPTATPGPLQAPVAAGGEKGMDGPTYAVRLRDLEGRVDELKDQIRRSHTRLALLSDTILSGGASGSRAEIGLSNEMSSAFRL